MMSRSDLSFREWEREVFAVGAECAGVVVVRVVVWFAAIRANPGRATLIVAWVNILCGGATVAFVWP